MQGVVVPTAGGRDPGEGRIGDLAVDPILDGDPGAVPLLDVLDQPVVLRGEELREGVGVLVHVVVDVEHRIGELPVADPEELLVAHARLLRIGSARAARPGS